jgi:hypothetical protein
MVEFFEDVGTLKTVDEVVVEERVANGLEDTERTLTVRLHEIVAVAVLVSKVVVADKRGFAKCVEKVASKGKQCVVDTESGQDGRPKVNLLGDFFTS